MTREDIIRLAHEAGLGDSLDDSDSVWICDGLYENEIQQFAALVAAAEREKVAAWMIDHDYATGHGDTIQDLLKELVWQAMERARRA